MSLFYQLSYFVTSFLMVALAALIFFRRPGERMVQAFMLFVMSIAGWIISLYFFYTLTDPAIVLLTGRLNFVFAEYIGFFAFLFSYYFPQRDKKIGARTLWVLFSAVTVLALVTLLTDLLDENEVIKGISRETHYGPLYFLFIVNFLGFAGASIVLLVKKFRRYTGKARSQLLIFALGWFATVVFGATTQIFIPLLTGNYDVQNLGPVSTFFLALATGYAVARHQMLKVELIFAELVVVAMLLMYVVNVALSTSGPGMFIGSASFVLGAFLGGNLIRRLKMEEKQHEKLNELTVKLADVNAQLEAADEAKSEFISIASHQLRTPASVLKGYLALMLEGAYGEINPTFKEKLEQMYSMNERLIHLINNILNMSRIEKNRLEFMCSYVEVPSIIEEVVGELMTKARDKGLQLSYAPSATPLTKAYVDGDKLHEIVVNLVENAIKYSIKGAVEVRTEMRGGKEGEEVVITVTDTGIGMSTEDTKRVFEKFYRAGNTAGVPRETGTGLGLYICAKFLDNMGGRIWIEGSAPGKGTTFAVALPTKPQQRCKV